MKKKGFTLIEIIVCIALISIIGVSSFFWIKYIKNKAVVSELSKITDKAIQAANVYLETNKEAHTQLYNNKNGVVLPLQLLVNEGLLNLDTTTLDDTKIKDQYVTTFLGTDPYQNCEAIKTVTSWSNSQPIYLCTNGDGDSNLAIINPDTTNNYTKATREKYYFIGSRANNWIKLKNTDIKYRIIYVDTDDSLVLYTDNEDAILNDRPFISELSSNVLPITNVSYGISAVVFCFDVTGRPYAEETRSNNDSEASSITEEISGIAGVNVDDILETSLCKYTGNSINMIDTWISYDTTTSYNQTSFYSSMPRSGNGRNFTPRKIHLKSCMKITSGTGDFANPFILENKCT